MMKRVTKRFTALLLAFVFAVALVPTMSVGAAEVVDSGTCGDNLTWMLDDEGTLTISGTGDMTDYPSAYDVPWYRSKSSIKTVVIENGVTHIGKRAFYECNVLENIKIPDSVISTGMDVFTGCVGITSFDVSVGNRSYCSPDGNLFNNDKTTLIRYATGKTDASYKIPDTVTRIDDFAFLGCTVLTSVEIPDTFTSIGINAFYNTGIYNDETNWKNEALYMGKYLLNVKNTVNGEYIVENDAAYIADGAFRDCRNLTSVIIHDNISNIGNSAFDGCDVLENVKIGDGVTSIGKNAFYNCNGLKSIDIPDSVTYIGDFAFESCNGLVNINVSENNQSYLSLDGILFDKEKNTLIQYTMGKTDEQYSIPSGVRAISAKAFYYCEDLKKVIIPDSVEYIGDYAFRSCTGLTEITIPNSVTGSIGVRTFAGCTALNSVIISDNITSISEDAFYGCQELKTIKIGRSVERLGEYALAGCVSLENIDVHKDNASYSSVNGDLFSKDKTLLIRYATGKTDTSYIIPTGVKTIGNNAFASCKYLKDIIMPESVTDIEYSAFSGCSGLTSIVLGNSVKKLGDYAFKSCSALTSVIIPGSLTSIGSFAFYECTGLTDVIISDGVEEICDNAFRGCSGIKSVTIGNSKISIKENAFFRCRAITDVYYAGSEEEWQNIDIGFNNDNLKSASMHYNYEPPKNTVTVSDEYSEKIDAAFQKLGNNIKVVVDIRDKTAEIKPIVFAASYNGDKLGSAQQLIKSTNGDETIYTGNVGGDNYRIFIWDENLVPITYAYDSNNN